MVMPRLGISPGPYHAVDGADAAEAATEADDVLVEVEEILLRDAQAAAAQAHDAQAAAAAAQAHDAVAVAQAAKHKAKEELDRLRRIVAMPTSAVWLHPWGVRGLLGFGRSAGDDLKAAAMFAAATLAASVVGLHSSLLPPDAWTSALTGPAAAETPPDAGFVDSSSGLLVDEEEELRLRVAAVGTAVALYSALASLLLVGVLWRTASRLSGEDLAGCCVSLALWLPALGSGASVVGLAVAAVCVSSVPVGLTIGGMAAVIVLAACTAQGAERRKLQEALQAERERAAVLEPLQAATLAAADARLEYLLNDAALEP